MLDYPQRLNNDNLRGRGTERAYSLDKLRVLCAFLVVCIHAPFPDAGGGYFTSLARIAVPIFFMLSGYFWRPQDNRKQVIKILKLMITANSFYFLFNLGRAVLHHEAFSYLRSVFSWRALAKFVLFNDSPFSPHLWYLGAILHVLMVVGMLEKLELEKYLIFIVPFLLIGDLALGKYSLLLFRCEFPFILVRNWLFVGIPFFTLGRIVRKRKSSISQRTNRGIVAIAVLLFAITSILESYFLVQYGLNATRDHYVSTTFFAVSVFVYFLFYVKNSRNTVSDIGKKDSTLIYILHYLVLIVFSSLLNNTKVYSAYLYVRPIVIFTFTVALTEAFNRMRVKAVNVYR